MSSFSDSVFDKIYLLAVEWGCLLLDIQTLEIVRKANRLANDLCTRDPHRIARELGIEVIPLTFKKQRGAYKVLMRNRFIFIKDDLHPVMAVSYTHLFSMSYFIYRPSCCKKCCNYCKEMIPHGYEVRCVEIVKSL